MFHSFPSKLKIVKVTPIYRSEDRYAVNHYGPIFVPPIVSKIIRKIIYHRLLDFISKNNLLCTNQFGFKEKHSTFMAILNLIDKISFELITNVCLWVFLMTCQKVLICLIIKF